MASNSANHLTDLPAGDLAALAAALRTGRLAAPYSPGALGRVVGRSSSEGAAQALQALAGEGFTPSQIAVVSELLRNATAPQLALEELVELVTSGPETAGVTNRDTAVVVRNLFQGAGRSVVLAGYAVYRGHVVFQALAQRMVDLPALQVRLLLDVRRDYGDAGSEDLIVKRFLAAFRCEDWPDGAPLPEIYYDPRALDPTPTRRAALHAKCIIVDGANAFVSSANFTQAAQEKNIEVGLLLRSPALASKLEMHFNALIGSGVLRRAC